MSQIIYTENTPIVNFEGAPAHYFSGTGEYRYPYATFKALLAKAKSLIVRLGMLESQLVHKDKRIVNLIGQADRNYNLRIAAERENQALKFKIQLFKHLIEAETSTSQHEVRNLNSQIKALQEAINARDRSILADEREIIRLEKVLAGIRKELGSTGFTTRVPKAEVTGYSPSSSPASPVPKASNVPDTAAGASQGFTCGDQASPSPKVEIKTVSPWAIATKEDKNLSWNALAGSWKYM